MAINGTTFGHYLFGDLLPVPILTVTEDRYWPALQAFVARENEIMNELMSLLCDTGTDVQTGYNGSSGGEFQRFGEYGGLEATRLGKRWYAGYPIFGFGDRSAYTSAYLKRAKFEDLAADIENKVLRDTTTVIRELLRALTNNVNYTFDDGKWPGRNAGAVPVKRLANADGGDGSVYGYGREIALASLNHYLISGSNTLDVNAFKLARTALRNVAHDKQILYMVSRATADLAEGLTGAVGGSLADSFSLPVQPAIVDILGRYSRASIPGILDAPQFRGRIARGDLIEMPHFPDGYIFAMDYSKDRPLRMRLSDQPDEQGLRLIMDDDKPEVPNSPLTNKYWQRVFGLGARNRVNGVLVQITDGSGSGGLYVPPTI